MAEPSNTSKGGLFFFVLALVFGGALAASPFYFKFIQSEDRQRDAAVADDVETVRRAVLNLDQHLASFKDMRASEDAKPDDALLSRQDLMSKELAATLSHTAGILSDVPKRDKDPRGMKTWADQSANKIARGAVNAKTAYNDVQSKYVSAHEKMLKDADAAVNRLKSAGPHLWSDRIQAVLGLAKGQLQRNRAEFEDWQAAVRRDAAEALAGPRAQMQRTLAALDARKPTDALAAISRQLEQNAAAQGVVQAALAKLSSEIKSKEDRVAQLESSAASARARMEELHGSGAKAAALPQQYADLSDESRKAEAEATALSNGTLEGAQMSYADDDGIKPAYSGGRQQPGLRDLKLRQAELRAQQDALKSRQTALTQQQEALNDMASKLDAQRAEVEKQAEGLSQRINEILAEADQHAEAAKKSQDEALKNFSAASKLAKSAVTAAKKRTTDAKNAMSGATPDERLQRITNDVDMEASMHCLSAELAYLAATIHASRIETIRADAATKSAVAAASGGAKAEPAEDEIDKLRTDAVDQLAEAQKSYEQAASLIGKSNVKLAEGSASGKNYLWQVQVGQAAVNMLQGVLLADKPEEATAAKEKAYKLLTDAAKGREQSPLLAPAIDALVQLQQSAR